MIRYTVRCCSSMKLTWEESYFHINDTVFVLILDLLMLSWGSTIMLRCVLFSTTHPVYTLYLYTVFLFYIHILLTYSSYCVSVSFTYSLNWYSKWHPTPWQIHGMGNPELSYSDGKVPARGWDGGSNGPQSPLFWCLQWSQESGRWVLLSSFLFILPYLNTGVLFKCCAA